MYASAHHPDKPRDSLEYLHDSHRGSREFQRSLGSYLRRELGERIRDVKMVDSARAPLMQLADMCIGAITRAERDPEDGGRWKRMIARRIENISHFG
jgi:Protein of unknown function (DUF3800)